MVMATKTKTFDNWTELQAWADEHERGLEAGCYRGDEDRIWTCEVGDTTVEVWVRYQEVFTYGEYGKSMVYCKEYVVVHKYPNMDGSICTDIRSCDDYVEAMERAEWLMEA